MKLNSPPLLLALLAGALAGCATDPHGSTGAAQVNMGESHMASMCEMHKQMMASGKTPVEQQAAMQERMKSMSPEMRQRMMARMDQCR